MGRIAVWFPANSSHILALRTQRQILIVISSHMCCVELALDRLLCTHLSSKGFLRRGFPHSLPQRLCHTCGPQLGQNSCLWLPLHAWYGSVHAWGTGPAMGWCMCAPCFTFALFLMQSNKAQSIFINYCISWHFWTNIQQRARIGKIFARFGT